MRPIRILIVDDSVVARAALSRILQDCSSFAVAGAIDSAERAIEWLSTGHVDIVLLDIAMPGRGGLAALPDLFAASGGARILIVSSLAGDGARATVEALALGAADTIEKPQGGGIGRVFGDLLIDRLLRLGSAPVAPPVDGTNDLQLRNGPDTSLACVAIGASTGGLHALAQFFDALSPSFAAPILVTQHLPASFMSYFAEHLQTMSHRTVHVAQGGEALEHDSVWVAPGHAHLTVGRNGRAVYTRLIAAPAVSRCCPSVDPMLESVSAVFGTRSAGVVLTGMGRDGAIGAQAMAASGGTLLVQDARSSIVWGMPGTVARAGLATLCAPPARLARYLGQRGSA